MAKDKQQLAALLKEREASPFRSCQWPFGDPGDKDFHFCGDSTHGAFSYCAKHVAMAYREPEPRRNSSNSHGRRAA